MKDWERDLLLLLSQEDNPVFHKVPGATSIEEKLQSIEDFEDQLALPSTSPCRDAGSLSRKSLTSIYIRPRLKKVGSYETEETKDMSLPQLQRVVLLKNLELQNLQIQKEKKEL